MMTENSETTANRTSYVQGYRLDNGDHDMATCRRSSKLTTTRATPLSPRTATMAMPATVAVVAVVYIASLAHGEKAAE
ncbi:hypothetical protein EV1_013245 [Malus domestica]